LHRPFMLLCVLATEKRAEVSAFACPWISFLRIEPVLARLEFADHDTLEKMERVFIAFSQILYRYLTLSGWLSRAGSSDDVPCAEALIGFSQQTRFLPSQTPAATG